MDLNWVCGVLIPVGCCCEVTCEWTTEAPCVQQNGEAAQHSPKKENSTTEPVTDSCQKDLKSMTGNTQWENELFIPIIVTVHGWNMSHTYYSFHLLVHIVWLCTWYCLISHDKVFQLAVPFRCMSHGIISILYQKSPIFWFFSQTFHFCILPALYCISLQLSPSVMWTCGSYTEIEMYDFGFWEYAMWNIKRFPMFLQTAQLPSSELMSLGTSKITAKDITHDDNNCNVWWNSGKLSTFYMEIHKS